MFIETKEYSDILWNWKTSSFLVIDDISPDKHQVTNPNDFLKHIDTYKSKNKGNRKTLKNKNIIWVLGINEINEKEQWSNMLHKIGVDDNNISIVNLSH